MKKPLLGTLPRAIAFFAISFIFTLRILSNVIPDEKSEKPPLAEKQVTRAEKDIAVKKQESSDHYSNQYADEVAEKRKQQRKAEAKKAQEEERQEKIKSQFSAWDGSHKKLEQYIKLIMNDPDSYKHAETVYYDMGEFLTVVTTFRGKNAFGGIVKQTIRGKVSIDGELLSADVLE